jgi:hypothetical protein
VSPRKLTIADIVGLASSMPVVQAAAQLGTVDPIWPFLPSGSSLTTGRALVFIESLFDQIPAAHHVNELAQYLAIATASHVLDGWRYISQSAFALLNGSRTQALHLAYYGELRAALAILAFSGVGVLNDRHFALTKGGDVIWFRGPTHQKTWEAIAAWAKQPAHGLEVINCYSCLGLSGAEWAEAAGAASGATVQDIAEYWIVDWTIDLNALNTDSSLRNEASYRPNLRPNALDLPSELDLRFIRDTNAATNPVDHGEFDVIDRAMVYDLCRKSFGLLFAPTRTSFVNFWGSVITWLVRNKGKTEHEAAEMVRSLRGALYEPGGKLILTARKKNREINGVFSRAFLLLRLASALLRRQWKETRLLKTPQDWQDQLVLNYVNHSLAYDRAAAPRSYTTLAADQDLAMEDIEDWVAQNVPFDIHNLWKSQSPALVSLCRLERVGAVAIAI